jgi:hypothetical protein
MVIPHKVTVSIGRIGVITMREGLRYTYTWIEEQFQLRKRGLKVIREL